MGLVRYARAMDVIVAVVGTIGFIAVIAYVYRSQSVSPPHSPAAPAAPERPSADEADGNEAASWRVPAAGQRPGAQQPGPAARDLHGGTVTRGGYEPDLSTPATAVYSVLDLIERGATDGLNDCFVADVNDPASDLYPRCLGHPVALMDVVEEAETAKVVWEATVHTAFTRRGKQWSPSETMTLATQLVRVNGFWKLVRLCDGEEDETSARGKHAN